MSRFKVHASDRPIADDFVKAVVRVVTINLKVPWGVLQARRRRATVGELSFYTMLGTLKTRIPECLQPDLHPHN